MSLLSDAVKIADSVTQSLKLQVDIIHEPWVSQTTQGRPSYGGATTISAVVEFKQARVQSAGQEVTSRATITFPRDVEVAVKDRITLPDGSKGPILSVGGPVDPETGRGFATTVYI